MVSEYHQLELDENKRFTRLNFSELRRRGLHHKIQTILADIPGAMNIHGDILDFANNQNEYDEIFKTVLLKCEDQGITLNL